MVTPKKSVKLATEALRRRLSVGIGGETTPDIETGKRKSVMDPLLGSVNVPDSEIRQRKEIPRYVPEDWDDSLPYGGKVYLARRKKPDSWLCIISQAGVAVFALWLMYYGWFYTENIHFHVTKLYAQMGHKDAQALIGHKLLYGRGIDQNRSEAMVWLHEAAKLGHPHASYNVAVGHLQGLKTGLKKGEAKMFIEHAAANGVPEAVETMERLCKYGRCDDADKYDEDDGNDDDDNNKDYNNNYDDFANDDDVNDGDN